MRVFEILARGAGAALCAFFSAAMLWAAWRLAGGEPFFAACGVFVAAFWGALCGGLVWSGICRWHDAQGADYPPASVLFPGGRK